MTADLILSNAHMYGVTKFDVRIDEVFRVNLSPDAVGTARWFADNDSVLDIAVDADGGSAGITATGTGSCEIQIQVSGAIVLTLNVEVFSPEAASLGVSAGTAEPK